MYTHEQWKRMGNKELEGVLKSILSQKKNDLNGLVLNLARGSLQVGTKIAQNKENEHLDAVKQIDFMTAMSQQIIEIEAVVRFIENCLGHGSGNTLKQTLMEKYHQTLGRLESEAGFATSVFSGINPAAQEAIKSKKPFAISDKRKKSMVSHQNRIFRDIAIIEFAQSLGIVGD